MTKRLPTSAALAACALAGLLGAAPAGADSPRLTACETGQQGPVRHFERLADGTERWIEVCGEEILTCEKVPGEERLCIVTFHVGQEPLEQAIARALTVKVNAPRRDPNRVYGTFFDAPRALVPGGITNPHPALERALLPIAGLPAAAVCAVTPGYFTGPLLAELLGPSAHSYQVEQVSPWQPLSSPGLRVVLSPTGKAGQPRLALHVTFDGAGSVACLGSASPRYGSQFEQAERRFFEQISWRAGGPGTTRPSLRWATETLHPETLRGFEARREQAVPSDSVRVGEHELELLRVLVPPHASISQLELSRSWERTDKRGRLLQATLRVSRGTRDLEKLASPVWGVLERHSFCTGVIDDLTVLTTCRAFAGVATKVETERALARARASTKPFRLEQQEYRALVDKDEPSRVRYERAASDPPGAFSVTINGTRSPLAVGPDGQPEREETPSVAGGISWASTPDAAKP